MEKLPGRTETSKSKIYARSSNISQLKRLLKVSVAAILSGNNDIQFKIGRTPYLDTFYAVRV